MSEREVGHAHLTGPTSWCWSAEIFVFHLFCVFSWQPHSHWPLSRHTILFHQIDDDEKRKNTLNFTLRFPEFLQFGKVFVQDEDFGQADGRHFSPLSPPSPGPVFQPTCNTWRNHSTLLSAVLFTVSLGWMSNLPGQKKLLFVEITARDGRTQKQQERPWLALAGLNSAEREMQLVASLLHPPSLISYLRITLPFIRSLLFPFSFFKRVSNLLWEEEDVPLRENGGGF